MVAIGAAVSGGHVAAVVVVAAVGNRDDIYFE